MHSDDGLKARIEEVEKDLLFYLRKYHELTSRSKFMKAVVDKEIRRLERELKELGKYYWPERCFPSWPEGKFPFLLLNLNAWQDEQSETFF